MTVYSEEIVAIPVGLGLDTYKHPANLDDGFVTEAENLIARGDSLLSRKGFEPATSIDTREVVSTLGADVRHVQLPASDNEDWPVAMWGASSLCWMARQFNRGTPSDTDTTEDGVKDFSGSIGNFVGACTYLDRIYVLTSTSGVDYLTAWNWAAGTVTKNNVIGSPLTSCNGLFIFKDRMWAWDNNKIYYTDAPATPGAYPEEWQSGGNFIVLGAGSGVGQIMQIIPANNRLFVFTTTGLHTVSVTGTPTSWIVKEVDNEISVNTEQCAYENAGLVYFVDINGVHVTNGIDVHPLSNPIKDLFDDSEKANDEYTLYRLLPFDEGFLVSTQNIAIDGTFPSAADRTLSTGRIFYTRREFIAWTEFVFDTTTQPGMVLGSFKDMQTHDQWTGNSYILLAHGESNDPIFDSHTMQYLRYTGYQDKLRQDGEAEETAAVSGHFKSKLIRGEMFQTKRAKYAFLNMSADASAVPDNFDVSVSWDTEELVNTSPHTVDSAFTQQLESLVKLPAKFHWRHCIVTVTFTLDSGISEYTFLGLGIVNHTNRREARETS